MPSPATAAVRLLTGEREPVRLATTANIDVDTGGLVIVDGVQTEVGDRILLTGQTDGSENGIRTASAGQWYRAADARTNRTMQKGTTVMVQEGTYAGRAFTFDTLDPVIGDDNLIITVVPLPLLAAQMIDEDDMASNSATKVPTQQSVKAYVDAGPSTAALQAVMRDRLDTAPYVATRTALKALDTTKDTVAYLTEAGREGWFMWNPVDFSAYVTADTAEGIYLKADAVASTAGAWVRDIEGEWHAHWFGVTSFNTEAGNVTAFNAMLALHNATQGAAAISIRSGNILGGAIGLNDKITYSTAYPLVLRGNEVDGTTLRWSNASGGLDLTYTVSQKPTSVFGLNLETSVAGGGTALKITGPSAGSITEGGAIVEDVDIRGMDVAADYWTKGIHLVTCWYPRIIRPDIKGMDDATSPFDMTHGIHLEDCQAPQISSVSIFHLERAIYASGSTHGEGMNIEGGEIVGVSYGIDWDIGALKPGIAVHDLHINAYVRCIKATFLAQASLHDLHLYKSAPSTSAWQAMELNNCLALRVHDIYMSTPGVSGGTCDGITLVDCDYCSIHNITADNWFSTGAMVLVATGADNNTIGNLKIGTSPASLVPVGFAGSPGTANKFYGMAIAPTGITFTSTDTTPSVGNDVFGVWKTSNGSATSITTFDDGYDGQMIEVQVGDVNTTFVNGATLALRGGNSTLVPTGGIIRFRKDSTVWRETYRSWLGLVGTATWDPASIAASATTATTVTVTGAALGDPVVASFSLDQAGLSMDAYVSSANTVFVRLKNNTAGTVDLASGTLKATVFK